MGLFAAMMKSRLLTWPRKVLNRLSSAAIRHRKGTTVYYYDDARVRVFDLIQEIRSECSMVVTDCEAQQLVTLVEGTAKVKGEIAEIGVYRGGTAKLICESKGERALHLFDTFEGMPEVEEIDQPFFAGKFPTTLELVEAYLEPYQGVFFHKGLFPETAAAVEDTRFSLVHFDADLYAPAKACLEFFYPRLNPGGVFLIHDYPDAPGVVKAVDEFFAGKPEPVIQLQQKQVLVSKL